MAAGTPLEAMTMTMATADDDRAAQELSSRFGIEPQAVDLPDALGETLGVGVVLGQEVDIVVQGVKGGRGQNAGLPHAAAQHFAVAEGLADQIGRAGQGG